MLINVSFLLEEALYSHQQLQHLIIHLLNLLEKLRRLTFCWGEQLHHFLSH